MYCTQSHGFKIHFILSKKWPDGQTSASLNEWQKLSANRLVSQMRATQAVSREPAGSYDNCARCYMFLNKKQYLLSHAQFTRTVIF